MCWNWLRVVHSSSLCTLFPNAALQWSQVGSLKLVRAGVFMQRRLANVTNRGWFFIFLLESHLLIIYQHRPETRQESAVSLTHIQIQSERAQSFKLKQWLCFEMNSVWNENSNNWLHVRHKGIELPFYFSAYPSLRHSCCFFRNFSIEAAIHSELLELTLFNVWFKFYLIYRVRMCY